MSRTSCVTLTSRRHTRTSGRVRSATGVSLRRVQPAPCSFGDAMSLVRRSAIAALLIVLAVASTGNAADPTPLGCRRAIVKAAGKYGVTYAKSTSVCWLQVVAGKTMPPCPDDKAFDKIDK